MRPRSLRELTEMAREEMAPTEEERSRVYDSLRLALAAGAAGAGLAATATASAAVSSSATAASTTAASTTAASTTAAASGAAAQGGTLAAGAAQAGGALTLSSGLLLKSLVLLVAVGGGAGMMTMGSEEDVADRAQHARTDEAVPLRRETAEPIRLPPEAPLAAQELGAQEEGPASPRSRQSSGRTFVEARRSASDNEEPSDADESHASAGAGAALTRAARRLQGAQHAMARGDGAAALALLAEDGDPRLQAERLALRVLALCQVGDEEGARSEADKLRALDDPSSAALARIGNSCVGP